MDIGTHIVTGLVLSSFFDEPIAKIACIVGAVIPDAIGIPKYRHRFKGTKVREAVRMVKKREFPPSPDHLMQLYYLSHSFLFVTILFLFSRYFSSPVFFAFSIGYLSHIIWDIPTHTDEWANRPLYPFSDWKIQGVASWWLHKEMLLLMVVVWIVLLTLSVRFL